MSSQTFAPVQQNDGWRAALPADSTAAQPDAPQVSAADLSAEDVDVAMSGDGIAAVAEQLDAAVDDLEAAESGMSLADAPADTSAEQGTAASAAAAAAVEEQLLAPAEASTDEVLGIGMGLSPSTDDSAANAE